MIPTIEIIEDDKKNARIKYLESSKILPSSNYHLVKDHKAGIINIINLARTERVGQNIYK